MIFIPLCQLSLKSSLFSKRRLGQDPTNAKGRLKRQIAAINELTQTETAKNAVTSVYAVKRSRQPDPQY